MKVENFEESMIKLEDISKKLESEDLSLDESVKLFEEGMKTAKHCKEILNNAEKKITILINNSEEDFNIE